MKPKRIDFDLDTPDPDGFADDNESVTAVLTFPEGPLGEFIFIYAPGAGSNVNDGFGSHLSHTLGGKGISSVRFQFPYYGGSSPQAG